MGQKAISQLSAQFSVNLCYKKDLEGPQYNPEAFLNEIDWKDLFVTEHLDKKAQVAN